MQDDPVKEMDVPSVKETVICTHGSYSVSRGVKKCQLCQFRSCSGFGQRKGHCTEWMKVGLDYCAVCVEERRGMYFLPFLLSLTQKFYLINSIASRTKTTKKQAPNLIPHVPVEPVVEIVEPVKVPVPEEPPQEEEPQLLEGFHCFKCGMKTRWSSSASRHKLICSEMIAVSLIQKPIRDKLRLHSNDFILLEESESQDVQFAFQQMDALFKQQEPPIPSISDSTSPLFVDLGWVNWLNEETKDTIVSYLPVGELYVQLAHELEEFWQTKVVLVKSLPAVARWVSSSGGTLNNALFRFPKDKTLNRRFEILVKMIGWIRYFHFKYLSLLTEYRGRAGSSSLEEDLVLMFERFESNKRSFIVEFMAALFCYGSQTSKSPIPPASALLTISKSIFWLYQFFKLIKLGLKPDFTDEEFVLETSAGMNVLGEIKVTFNSSENSD